jgi:signal transduction histidine kinase
MKGQLVHLPYVRALWITDATGRTVADTDAETVGFDFSDRRYFRVHRDLQPHDHLFIGPPVVSRSNKTFFVPMSRPILRAGQFAGVVVAAFEPPRMEDFYKSLGLGNAAAVTLMHRDGELIARSPHQESKVGTSMADSPLFSNAALGRHEVGTLTGKSVIDGITRILSYRVIDGMPLVVSVGVDEESVLRSWRERSAALVLISACLVAAVILLAGMLVREARRRQRAWAEDVRKSDELERRVRARTEQLESANEQLSAFSYSISHDLRAPLRSIDGYAGMLGDELGEAVTPEARRYLAAVRYAAMDMNRMIEDLLAFSQLGSQALSVARVDLGTMIGSVLHDVLDRHSRHLPRMCVGELPDCDADPSLLRQVWLNLIDNAVKYSSVRDQPMVEIGSEAVAAETVYFVRDNGVGFDPAFADRLFTVFQRLHTDKRFPGSGVGLAIVQRIVQQHGGRIWAESAPDAGATFRFTLNPPADASAHSA